MKQFKTRKRNRLNKYDYSLNGYYYLTICSHNHENKFGTIDKNIVVLNPYGKIAKNAWLNLPNHHDNIQLDEFIIMPNHIHGIIIINSHIVGYGPARTIIKETKTNNLSTIIGSYKSTVTKQINQIEHNAFIWQRSFYDHIIRNEKSLNEIKEYILNNPATWEDDENNIKNL